MTDSSWCGRTWPWPSRFQQLKQKQNKTVLWYFVLKCREGARIK
jgi:hypothetical protein